MKFSIKNNLIIFFIFIAFINSEKLIAQNTQYPLYNAPKKINVPCSHNFFLSGSFIYWQARDYGFEIATLTSPNSSNLLDTSRNIKYINFDFHPGFKLGFSTSLHNDDWNFFLDYTRFYSKNHGSASVHNTNVSGFLSSSWILGTSFNAPSFIEGKWILDYNIFDSNISRTFFVGKKLIFATHLGLRSGWIDQKFNSFSLVQNRNNLNQVINDYSNCRSNSWTIGPRLGLNTSWKINYGFKIFNTIATSLLYQHFNTKIRFFVPTNRYINSQISTSKNITNRIIPNIDTSIGISWEKSINNRYHFEILSSYDFQYLWNQNQIRSLADVSGSFSTFFPIEDLMIQGLTISAKFDF